MLLLLPDDNGKLLSSPLINPMGPPPAPDAGPCGCCCCCCPTPMLVLALVPDNIPINCCICSGDIAGLGLDPAPPPAPAAAGCPAGPCCGCCCCGCACPLVGIVYCPLGLCKYWFATSEALRCPCELPVSLDEFGASATRTLLVVFACACVGV